MPLSRLAACAAAILLPGAVLADDATARMQDFLDSNIRAWAGEPVLIQAIQAQNRTTAAYTQAEIDALDTAWRAEVGAGTRPTIDPVLSNAASAFLREVVENGGGAITEVFVMDARGLNVAASAVTSDYWQGDEAKFTETYAVGPDAVHFGEVEFDESSQTYQTQISLSLVDPASREVIGAMTVGVDAEALF